MARRTRRRKAAADIATNWVRAMGSAETSKAYQEGTRGKGQEAMSAAASTEALTKYSDGCTRSVTNGSRARSLNDPLSAQLYNDNTQTVGAQRLGPGAQKKKMKYQAQMERLGPVHDRMKAAAEAIDPTGSKATAGQRAAAAIEVLVAAGKKAGGA